MIIIQGMNKNYKPRWIAELMRNSLENACVMVLTGARQYYLFGNFGLIP